LAGNWDQDFAFKVYKTTASTTVWTATVTTEPKIVFFDGVKGTNVASQAACNSEGKWYWAGNVLSVYSATDPDTAYTSPGIEVGARDYCLGPAGHSYLTFDNLKLEKTNALFMNSSGTHVTVSNCELAYSPGHGIVFGTTSGDNVVEDSEIYGCGTPGGATGAIFTWKDAATAGHENIIRRNYIHDNPGQFGIEINSNYYIVEYNKLSTNGNSAEECVGIEVCNYDNDGYAQHVTVRYNQVIAQDGNSCAVGINADDYARYVDIYGNIAYGCSGSGFGVWRANDINLYNNTAYGNNLDFHSLLTIFAELPIRGSAPGNVSNIVVKNNAMQATEANTYAVYLDANTYGSSGLSITNNCWYAAATNWYFWNATGGNNLATWNALTGVGTDLNSDPAFTNAAGGDFTLAGTSPCRDAGVNLGAAYDDTLMPGSLWPADVILGDQDEHGPGWEIGAYIFPKMMLRAGVGGS
jgi:hypothetical protein